MRLAQHMLPVTAIMLRVLFTASTHKKQAHDLLLRTEFVGAGGLL